MNGSDVCYNTDEPWKRDMKEASHRTATEGNNIKLENRYRHNGISGISQGD